MFQTDSDKKQVFKDTEDKIFYSSFFATEANDTATLNYLFNEKKVPLGNLTANESISPEFIEILVKQPPSNELQKALLDTILVNILYPKNIESVINCYNQLFTKFDDQKRLKECLQLLFQQISIDSLKRINKNGDHRFLIDLYKNYQITEDVNKITTTIYHYLKLITLTSNHLEKAVNFIKKLSTEQLQNQIRIAATLNNSNLLELLLKNYQEVQSEPSNIFSKELIQNINPENLKRLINHGILVNPELVSECFERKDIAIFNIYMQAIKPQTFQEEPILLKQKIGNINFLSQLIFLNYLDLIQKYWNETIDAETISDSLFLAMKLEKPEISNFLHEKLLEKQSRLNQPLIDLLIEHAINERNSIILSLLVQFEYNILGSKQNINKLLGLADSENDYSFIKQSFLLASTPIKKQILIWGLTYNIPAAIELSIENNPQLLLTMTKESIALKNSDHILYYLNASYNLPFMNEAQEHLKNYALEEQPKSFIRYCYIKKLTQLVQSLSPSINWSAQELDKLLADFIKSKNESAISLLLELHPQLQKTENLMQTLLENNFFSTFNVLLNTDLHLDNSQFNSLIEHAIINNKPDLLKKLLSTPEQKLTMSLSTILKQAIAKGNLAVIELFINSDADFGLDFKELFLYSCEQEKPAIANQLLAKPFTLNPEDKQRMVKLFGNKTAAAIYEENYQQGYSRLHVLLCKSKIEYFPNPQANLLRSIENPELDALHPKVSYLLIKRAIQDRKGTLFNKLANQTAFPDHPNERILTLIAENPELPVINFFEKKYGWQNLLTLALKNENFTVVAFLLEKQPASKVDPRINKEIQANAKNIIKAFQIALPNMFLKSDQRPRLFKLLDPLAPPNGLTALAKPFQNQIHNTISLLETYMLEFKLNLNNKIYRYETNLSNFDSALQELRQLFLATDHFIKNNQIDLDKKTQDKTLINYFAEIKRIMAAFEITPYYLGDEQKFLLNELINNPGFKEVCQLEIKIYSLIKQLNLIKIPLANRSEAEQKEFIETALILKNALINNNLSEDFVIPEVREHLLKAQEFSQQNSSKKWQIIEAHLIKNVSELLCKQLDFNKQEWKMISSALKSKIKQESQEILAEILATFDETQKTIIANNLNNNFLISEITGSCQRDDMFNLTLGTGYENSGLTQVYFDCLSLKPLLSRGLQFFSSTPNDEKLLTDNNLLMDKEARKQQIMLSLCKTIAENASLKELKNLIKESNKSPDSEAMKILKKDAELYMDYCESLELIKERKLNSEPSSGLRF